MKPVGPLIKQILRYRKLEQKDLAAAIGLSDQQTSVLLKNGAEKWKLIYFDKACSYLHISPKHFFENWDEPGNFVNGNIENNAILGTSNFSMIAGSDSLKLEAELRARISDKDSQISALNEIISLQRMIIKQAGITMEGAS